MTVVVRTRRGLRNMAWDAPYRLLRAQSHDAVVYTYGVPQKPIQGFHEPVGIGLLTGPDATERPRMRIYVAEHALADYLDLPEYREIDDPATYAGSVMVLAQAMHESRKERSRRG